MNNLFGKIVDQLREQEAEFANEVLQLKQELATKTKQLSQVQTAIHSLSGKSASPAISPAKPTAKATLSVDEIQQIVFDAKRSNQSITEEQLFERVATELAAKGGKKHGLKAKFQKVLSELAEKPN